MLVCVAIFEPRQTWNEFDELGPLDKRVVVVTCMSLLTTSLLAHVKGLDHLCVVDVLDASTQKMQNLV